MGFTIYWYQNYPVSQPVWDTFVSRALRLIKRSRTGEVQLENRATRQKNVLTFSGSPEAESGGAFYVQKDEDPERENGFGFCGTGRHPYTTDVFICLILMYDLGMLSRFSSVDMHEKYPEALDYVSQNLALKNSLDSLERMGVDENNNNNNNNNSNNNNGAAAASAAASAANVGQNKQGSRKTKRQKSWRSKSRRRRGRRSLF